MNFRFSILFRPGKGHVRLPAGNGYATGSFQSEMAVWLAVSTAGEPDLPVAPQRS
jgi:hypothetical protein